MKEFPFSLDKMPETIIESVLTGKLDFKLLIKWLNNESIEDTPEDCILFSCNRNEFVAFFLSYLRNQTESILQTNSSAPPPLHQTPDKVHNPRRKHRRSISEPTTDDKDTLSVKSQSQRSQESPSKDRKRTGRRVKTKLFPDDRNLSVSSDESRLSIGLDRIASSSTPLKNGVKLSDYSNAVSPVTPHRSFHNERCDTPRLSANHSHRHRSHEKSCLGDFIVTAQKSSKKKKGRNASDDSETKIDLDLSNSDVFPEIGMRKSSSLRSEKRRIKPTNIDKSTSRKSLSLNSFNSECFQQPSPLALEDNLAFKQHNIQPKESANSFEAERSMLKMERHKLMEKFNILNTTASPKAAPIIKITHKESFEKPPCYVQTDMANVMFKDKLDMLVDMYDVFINKNLILSVNTEIYFLISILHSKQNEDDFNIAEKSLKENNLNFLLKVIHNSTYFAVKCLWNLRVILEVILDKNSLKILGENKKVRGFYPELAKFLLNSYGLKCEMENGHEKRVENRVSNGVICFNQETDNVDNFPSVMSFQNFKKQRDMFYEIVRWYQDSQSTGASRCSFRARVKTLLSAGGTAANYTHLAALFTQHMLAECPPGTTQESKLSKLHRRLTCPTTESHNTPTFVGAQAFYRDFVLSTDSEPFRVHLRDALAAELVTLDAASVDSSTDVSKQFLRLSRKLSLVAKFLGLLASLPYTLSADVAKTPLPRELTHLENNLVLRQYSQPTIDLKGMLSNAIQTSRIAITIPWLVHYLSVVDYTTLRTRYYQDILKTLRYIYVHCLQFTNQQFRKNTVIYLKCVLGWLFDLPHMPDVIEGFCKISANSEVNLDSLELVDEYILFDLCPYLRDVNVLVATCKVNKDSEGAGSVRHITPVSLTLNPEDRLRSKEKELQARLEEEMLKSQPSSTRRVLELVTERVCASTVRELARALTSAREKANMAAAKMVRERGGTSQAVLLQSLQALYTEHFQQLRSSALECASTSSRRRAAAALQALLPAAPPALRALAASGCRARLARWLADNWSGSAILCKDIESEMKNLIAVGEPVTNKGSSGVNLKISPAEWEQRTNSPAACLIYLKEQICLLLDDEEPTQLSTVLADCAQCCGPLNLFNRPPTQRAILQLSVDLCVVYVSRKPNNITDEFLDQLHQIWQTCCPDRKPESPDIMPERPDNDERAPTPVSDEDNTPIVINAKCSDYKVITAKCSDDKVEVKSDYEFFDRILCARNVVLLTSSKCKAKEVWEGLATVLVFMLKNNYLNEDSLTEQCLAVYRQDWPQSVLENLSTCMKSVSSRWRRSSAGKFTLFLDFLAEYCGDLDYEALD